MANEYEFVLAKQIIFNTINSIGRPFKFILNPRWNFLYRVYKKKEICR